MLPICGIVGQCFRGYSPLFMHTHSLYGGLAYWDGRQDPASALAEVFSSVVLRTGALALLQVLCMSSLKPVPLCPAAARCLKAASWEMLPLAQAASGQLAGTPPLAQPSASEQGVRS